MSTSVGKVIEPIFVMCIGLSLFCFCGCDSDTPQVENRSDLEGRLEAAKLITSSSQKNAALEELAQIAAKAGDGKIVVQAISAINHSSVRNAAAESAAPLLAKAGKTEDAIAVVKLISDTSVRNRIFAEIATQE